MSDSGSARGRRPRILIDALSYYPGTGFATSLEHVLATCAALPEYEFVVAHHPRYARELATAGLRMHAVQFPLRLRFVISLLLLPWIVRRVRADAVYCDIGALPWGLGVPGAVTVHDLHFMWDPLASGTARRRRIFVDLYWLRTFVGSLRRARVIRAISRTTEADIHRLLPGAAPVVTVLQYVEVPAQPVPPREWPADDEPVRLVFLGSIVPRRNLPFLLEALPAFRRPWRLDVLGSPAWGMGDLGPLARDPRVTLHGFVSDEQRDAFLRDAHILIAPSVYEGFGAPVGEAMAHGALVLASDIEAFREFVPDDCRFSLESPQRLADLLNGLDAASYAHLREACASRVAMLSPEAHREGHRRLFAALIEAMPASGSPPRHSAATALRGWVRRTIAAALGAGAERTAHRLYHLARRLSGRFTPPEPPETLRLLASFAAGARTIIDVGANYGLYSHYLLRHGPADAVLYAFEPNAEAASLLRGNVPPSARVHHFDVAVGAAEGQATLHVPLDDAGNPVTALGWVGGTPGAPEGERADDSTVVVQTIDGLVASGAVAIRGPVLVKIDVEGSELAVLQGAGALLREARPLLYFECEPRHLRRMGIPDRAVWDLLAAAGYLVAGCRDGRYITCSGPIEGVVNYFAVPGAASLPDGTALSPAEVIARAAAWRAAGGA